MGTVDFKDSSRELRKIGLRGEGGEGREGERERGREGGREGGRGEREGGRERGRERGREGGGREGNDGMAIYCICLSLVTYCFAVYEKNRDGPILMN